MQSRNQYLETIRTEYLKTKSKLDRSQLLNEVTKRTGLDRKYLIKKLRPKSNIDNNPRQRKKRKSYYDNSFKTALVKLWKIFDYCCGQRLKSNLTKEIINKLKQNNEFSCSSEIEKKLLSISPKTIDRKLKHQREVEMINRKYKKKLHPLLYQQIPIKLASEQNRDELGNIQIDLVEHCGQSLLGEFLHTISHCDICSGWWEGEVVKNKGQIAVQVGIDRARKKFPFFWKEIHFDNGPEFMNYHLWRYCQKEGLKPSRSRPYKKNDNCFVEQKNNSHVRKIVGYNRYDTKEELIVLQEIYDLMHWYKNFFQPIMKLKDKIRIGGRIKRRYGTPKTPFKRVMELDEVPLEKKLELKKIYDSLNPAQLKREIDGKLDLLYKIYKQKEKSLKVRTELKNKKSENNFGVILNDSIRKISVS